jgi:hypothetical protein
MDTTVNRTNDLDLGLLIVSLLAGPAGWAIAEAVGYAAVKPVCAAGSPFVLGLIALVPLTAAGAGGWLARRRYISLRDVATESGGRDIDRSYFIAVVAAGLNALIALLIVTTMGSQLVSQCE